MNSYINAETSEINKNSILFNIPDGFTGFLHVSNISDYYVEDLNKYFKKKEIVVLKVLHVRNNIVYLSFKDDRAFFLRKPFDFVLEETEKGFKNLFEFTKKEIKKWQQ